ncbi:MAG: radical SAM protein [Lachnospiraceae bacterium]|nr:radical SAM protein [Lachnospiraceae bacterium]
MDRSSADNHRREILEEAEAKHPGFNATITDEDILIHALEIKTTSFCTLQCRDCTHLIPYSRHPKHVPAENIVHNLKKILTVSRIGGLILLGGEIFIYPYLSELIEGYRQLNLNDKVGFIRVTTNATVVPSDEFCEIFKSFENGYVFISDYGELSVKKQETIDKLRSFGIRVELGDTDLEWKDMGGIERRDYSEEEVKQLFNVCHGSIYLHLYGDHLYHCYRAPILNDDGLAPHKVSDYLDLANIEAAEFNKKLYAYINEKPYMESCYYCDGFHPGSSIIPKAVQLNA